MTKQMKHDGDMLHASICVPQLKCQHLGSTHHRVTLQRRIIYISTSHWPACFISVIHIHTTD